MWWTQQGERTLTGAEAALFREALGVTVDQALQSLDDDDAFGFPQFDRLTGNARLALLAEVGSALLREDVPMPDLNSLRELTVAVIYDQIVTFVSCEVDGDGSGDNASHRTAWREMILAACREQEIDPGEGLPAKDCDDQSDWEFLIEELRDCILWDEDWAIEDEVLDLDPAVARATKKFMNIADDYFRGIPPDPNEDELRKILDTLRQITDSPVYHPDFGLPGIEDQYHGIFAGPCTEAEADREAEHPLVLSVYLANARDFLMPFERWMAEVRPVIAGVSEMLPSNAPLPPVSEEEVRQALGPGLPDGTRFERREKGYVIVDDKGYYLTSTEDPVWYRGDDEDDEDQAAYFDTPEAAWLGLRRAEAIGRAIEERRSALLHRLGIKEDE